MLAFTSHTAEFVPLNPKTRSSVALAVIALAIIAGLVAWVALRGRTSGAFTHAAVTAGNRTVDAHANVVDSPMSPVMDRWLDTERTAKTTPRVSMGPVVQTLKTIRQDAAALRLPACAQPMQAHLVSAMDKSIEAHALFITGNIANRPRFQELRRASDADLRTGEEELVDLQKGQGACGRA